MTAAELAKHDGKDGRKAYIAVNGTIYDVTDSPRWEDGLHPPDHQAGQDLTEELTKAPHVRAVVERFPVIGNLEEPTEETNGGSGKIIAGIIVAVIIVVLIFFLLR
jgi:predicted heme/steroid binding protein